MPGLILIIWSANSDPAVYSRRNKNCFGRDSAQKQQSSQIARYKLFVRTLCTGSRTRTGMSLQTLVFETNASTDSAIPATIRSLCQTWVQN